MNAQSFSTDSKSISDDSVTKIYSTTGRRISQILFWITLVCGVILSLQAIFPSIEYFRVIATNEFGENTLMASVWVWGTFFLRNAIRLIFVSVGVLIYWQGWYTLDPIISIGIGIFIIKSAWDILLETVNILTEGTPKGIDLERVAAFIRSFPEVDNVHHLHIWSLSSNFRALSAHLVVKDRLISAGCAVTKKLEAALAKEFAINHPTLQLEAEVCEAQDVVVDINH